jgi:polar amino acid transport system substrate-binding protein
VRLGLAALLLALVGGATRVASAADLGSIRTRGELVWGGDLQGGEPYVFEDANDGGKLVGFEVDIADALARRLGVTARFRQNDWSNLPSNLLRGDFDIVLNGLEETPERAARLLLSRPYFVYGETLTVRAGSAFTRLDQLNGHRVGTLNQTVAHEMLKARGFEVVLYEGQEEPYFDLVRGRTDAVLLDHVIAERYGCVKKELYCVPGDVARGHYVIGMVPGNAALKAAVDGALGAMLADGELRRILSRWRLWDDRQLELTAAPGSTTESARAAERPLLTGRRHLGPAQLRLFLEGALVTLLLSLAAFAIASPLGVIAAILRLHGGRFVRFVAGAYVEIFRGTPLLLQLYVLYFGISDVVRLGPFTAAILALALNYGAYEAEVHRGALLALPRGQAEAARALGLGKWQALRHVLLPQSFRAALPAVTNDFVALLKDSSLVSVITVVELTKRMTIVAVELRDWVTPGLLCAALYFVLSFPLARLARRLERGLSHDQHPRFA